MATLQRKARITGLCYLGLGIAGGAGFLALRPRLFVDGDPAGTLAHLTEHPSLARLAVVVELLVVLTQALAAAGFYLLFRETDPVNALGIAAFGLVNATTILVSAALLGTAVSTGDAESVQLLYSAAGNLWTTGGIFFGLWLIPMGLAAIKARWPRALGILLVAGAAGYVVSAFTAYTTSGLEEVGSVLALPATVGEFWMIGYLLLRARRAPATRTVHAGATG